MSRISFPGKIYCLPQCKQQNVWKLNKLEPANDIERPPDFGAEPKKSHLMLKQTYLKLIQNVFQLVTSGKAKKEIKRECEVSVELTE